MNPITPVPAPTSNGKPPAWVSVLIFVGVLLYVVSPIDLLPDFFLCIGWLDDIAVLVSGIAYGATQLLAKPQASAAAIRSPEIEVIQRHSAETKR